jgi:hypothetical protein
VAHRCAGSLGDRNGQCPDSGRLVHGEQDLPVSGQPVEDLPQPGFVVGQRLVEEPLSRTVQGHGMVAGFPDIETYEYIFVQPPSPSR